MKKLMAAAAIGGALVAGPLLGAGTAQATPQDFFNSLENGSAIWHAWAAGGDTILT